MRRLEETIQDLILEICRSVRAHGNWSDYDERAIYNAVTDEHDEYQDAYMEGNIDGHHGQRAELLQLAAVAIKGYIRLGDKDPV